MGKNMFCMLRKGKGVKFKALKMIIMRCMQCHFSQDVESPLLSKLTLVASMTRIGDFAGSAA